MNKLLVVAIKAAVDAGKEILKVYENDIEVNYKKDNSPITEADLVSNRIIMDYLKPTQLPILSEENTEISYREREGWFDFWCVDPLDGTKEFVGRNGEFTVNIALINRNSPVLGVIYVPVSREIYFGDVKQNKTYKIVLDKEHKIPEALFHSNNELNLEDRENTRINVVGSRSHMDARTKEFVSCLKNRYSEVTLLARGSSLKFCMVAEGKADIYPRFHPTMEWDTAAGQAICKSVGLEVIDMSTGEIMEYNKRNLLNSSFIIKNKEFVIPTNFQDKIYE